MLVTHDMGVIAETCDRVAVMYAGRIVEIGPVDAVIHSPAHPYTVGLMGSIPAMDEDRARLLQIDGAMPRLTAIPAGCAFNPRCPRAFEPLPRRAARSDAGRRRRAACWLHAAAAAGGGVSDALVEVEGLAKTFDVSRALAQPGRRAQAAAVRPCGRRRRASASRRGTHARRWSANRAAARARWRACWSACTRRRAAGSSSTASTPPASGRPNVGAPADADDLPGPVREPQSALEGAGHRRRAAARARLRRRPLGREQRARLAERVGRAAELGRAAPRPTRRSFRTSSRAGSGSGSRSRARSRPSPSSWSATSRPRRSTSRCRRRCSTS